MKTINLLIFLFSSIFCQAIPPDKASLSGMITDVQTGMSLPGSFIYCPELKAGAISDSNGVYIIDNLPLSKILVHVTLIGFKQIVEIIDLSTTNTKDFAMEVSIAELNEVVVTGLSSSTEKNRTPTSISTLNSIQLRQISATNIIDALATQPGISQVTTGVGISKPVIRGLGYNRVVVVNDGIRQEGQQWGDEHGIEIDEYGVNHVEILKGPASLAYGSDALAGVINMLPAPVLPDDQIRGNILANYQTNNGLIGGSVNFAGNKNGMIWDLRYSQKLAHSYQNKFDGFVFNSGFRENILGGIMGVNKPWGYSHLHFSLYNLTPGIIEGDRDSATGQFIKPIAVNDTLESEALATKDDFKSYNPLTPYQEIHHYKMALNNNFILGDGSLKTILGWQQNQRQEFADILEEGQYGLYFFMNTLNYDVRYLLPESNHFNFSIGVNGMYQESQNKGSEFLIPDYRLFDFGIFSIVKKSWNKLDFIAGLRYDSRNEEGDHLWLNADGEKTDFPDSTSYHQFAAFNTKYEGVSASLGMAWRISDKLFTKLNFARGFRAPNIAEISANGVHEGTINFIIGVPTLKPENSFQIDYAFGINTPHITAEVDLFDNMIANYIYLQKLQSTTGSDSLTEGFSTFKYTAGDANIYGGEVSIDIHPHPWDWLHFENSLSYIQSIQSDQPDSSKYLPFTPAPKFTTEVRADIKKMGESLADLYFKIGLDNYFKQNHFYAAYGTETATPGYLLLNVGFGADVVDSKHTLFSVSVSATNLTDVAYQSHLSRLKYAGVNNSTGRTGVYNMGRNFNFKVIVPLGG